MALSEHASYSSNSVRQSMSSFFRMYPRKAKMPWNYHWGMETHRWNGCEQGCSCGYGRGVLNETLNGPLGELFDGRQLIKDVSGSGNNWAHGHCVTGHNTTIEYTKPSDRPRNFVTACNLFFSSIRSEVGPEVA